MRASACNKPSWWPEGPSNTQSAGVSTEPESWANLPSDDKDICFTMTPSMQCTGLRYQQSEAELDDVLAMTQYRVGPMVLRSNLHKIKPSVVAPHDQTAKVGPLALIIHDDARRAQQRQPRLFELVVDKLESVQAVHARPTNLRDCGDGLA